MSNLAGREVFGGSAYSIPYEMWHKDHPNVVFDVVQSWNQIDDTQVFLILGEWVDSWEEVEAAIVMKLEELG